MGNNNLISLLRKWTPIIIVGVCCFFIGFIIPKSYDYNFEKKSETRESGYNFINPLIECADNNQLISQYIPFEKDIKNLIESEILNQTNTDITVYYRDLNNGPWFSINGDLEYSSASLAKIPLAMAYYKMAEQTPEILAKNLKLDTNTCGHIPQLFEPIEKLIPNQTYTIEQLIRKLLTDSDNDAECLLQANLEYKYKRKIYDDLGLENYDLNASESHENIIVSQDVAPGKSIDLNKLYYANIKQYAGLFRILYNSSYLNREYSEKILTILSQSKFKQGLADKLPNNIVIANKYGSKNSSEIESLDQLHDCGIIYYPKNPYLLCIMTKHGETNDSINFISKISQIVYEEINNSLND